MSEPATFVAVILNGYVPPEPAAGVPASVAVPSWLSLNLTPRGSAPFSDKPGVGTPVDLTVKAQTLPAVHVVWLAVVIPGAWLTVSVKLWVAAGLTPFVAVIVNGYGPLEPAAGVPASVAVPSPLSLNVTPRGSAPFSDKPGVGTPLVVTVKVPAWPTVKVVPAGLVTLGAWLTVRVKGWVASGLTPFVALIVNGYVPPVFAAGVPASVAVPSPLSVNVTPDGSVSGAGKVHVGYPVVVTVKAPGWPTAKVAKSALVIWHAWSTVRVKLWVSSGMTSFVALIVNWYVPPVFAAGLPASVAVPFLLSVNVTPDGSVSGAGKMHVGYPVVVTVTVPAWPTAKVATAVLVIWHTWSTVRVKLWIAAGLAPFVAVIVIGYVPPVFAAGVPEIVAVPSPLSVHVSPGGSAPTTDN